MKEKILELRAKGYTYNQIAAELNVSKGLISYHCGEGQKEKSKARQTARRQNKLIKRLEIFSSTRELKPEKSIKFDERNAYHKARAFQRDITGAVKVPVDDQFHINDIYEIFKDSSVCYLTGRKIDLSDNKSYEFDHIIPRSKGGSSTIENLGLTTRDANRAKGDMSIEEFLQLCIDVLKNYDIIE